MTISLKTSLRHNPKKSSVAVYLGPESIEIVHMKHTAKGLSAVKYISKGIPKKDVTSSTIKEIFQTEGIKETAVTTTIPEESIMLRRFGMPIIPQKDRPTAVRFEAKRHIPFNIDEVISNFHVIKEDPAKNQMEILFAAVKKEEINSIISLLKGAGLTVERIEPISLALIKTLVVTGNLEDACPPTAILHFSSSSEAQILIVENGIPYLKREISLISKDSKAEEQLLNEFRLSSSYYKREFPEKNISKLIICGLKEKPEWLAAIKNELTIPVEHDLPLRNISGIDLANLQLEVPIGLACLRLEKPKIELNLLPKEFIPVKYNIKKWITIEAAAAICVLGLVYVAQIPSVIKLKKDVDTAGGKKVTYPGLELSAISTDELNMLMSALQGKRDILTACIKNRVNWHEKSNRLTYLMPKEIWITELAIKDPIDTRGSRTLTLKGSTYTPDPAREIEITNNFSKGLKDDTVFMYGFTKLTLGTINKATMEKHEVVNFDISVTTD